LRLTSTINVIIALSSRQYFSLMLSLKLASSLIIQLIM